MKRIYLDHNSTSPLRPEVLEHMRALLEQPLGNPSSAHELGRRARHCIDLARERVARALAVDETEIVFTSGGTESDNLALLGGLSAREPRAGLVTTVVEHSAVLGPARALESEGRAVVRVGVDRTGRVDPEAVVAAARSVSAGLVSLQAANNEVGTLQPVAEVGAALASFAPRERPLLHTDAVQALGRVPLDLRGWNVDLASFSAHKLGGPVGVGVLYRRRGVPVRALTSGGEQEQGLRPGTESALLISAAALALELAVSEQPRLHARTQAASTWLWRALQSALPGIRLHGPALASPLRLPNTLNIGFPDTDGKILVTRLDLEGLAVSAGSACASGSIEPSHVLLAMGLAPDEARAGLRLSLGWNTSEQDCKEAVGILLKTFSPSRASHGNSSRL